MEDTRQDVSQVIDLPAIEASLEINGGRHPFERLALALNSSLDLTEALRRIAGAGLDLTSARRSVIFLIEDHRLHVAVAVGADPDEDTASLVAEFGPLDLDSPGWQRLLAGRPLALRRELVEELIPVHWRKIFEPGSVLLVPLLADDQPCGLMALEWPDDRHFDADEVSTMEAFGACAGMAVRNARLFSSAQRRAQLQQALTRGATALVSMTEPAEIAECLAGAYTDLIGARLCAIALLDGDRSSITTVASRGTGPLRTPISFSEIPERLINRIGPEWERAKVPIELPPDPWLEEYLGGETSGASWYLLLPLVVAGHSRGCVFLGFDEGRYMDGEERLAARALADIAAAALERGQLLERQERRLQQLDALYRVSTALTAGGDARALVEELNILLKGLHVEVVSIALKDATLAARLGAQYLTPEEEAAWRARTDWSELSNGEASIPMRVGQRLFGALRVRPGNLDPEERAFLETLSRELAELANGEAMRARLEQAARDRALTEERDRLASDLHDTAGQMFVAINLLVTALAESLPADSNHRATAERVAHLADRGKSEISEVARALAFLPATKRGLAPALRALAADMASDSGIDVRVEIVGAERRLAPKIERGLYKVAHEAIANAWRHAECDVITVRLAFRDDEVRLEIVDDGKSAQRCGVEEGTGIAGMRRVARDLGGSIRVGPRRSHGFSVVLQLPGGTT